MIKFKTKEEIEKVAIYQFKKEKMAFADSKSVLSDNGKFMDKYKAPKLCLSRASEILWVLLPIIQRVDSPITQRQNYHYILGYTDNAFYLYCSYECINKVEEGTEFIKKALEKYNSYSREELKDLSNRMKKRGEVTDIDSGTVKILQKSNGDVFFNYTEIEKNSEDFVVEWIIKILPYNILKGDLFDLLEGNLNLVEDVLKWIEKHDDLDKEDRVDYSSAVLQVCSALKRAKLSPSEKYNMLTNEILLRPMMMK